jgi:tetratricopeptide (TPR) repeat protein
VQRRCWRKPGAVSNNRRDRRNGIYAAAQGGVAAEQSDIQRAQALYERSLALSHELGDKSDVAYARGALAALACQRGELDRARDLCEQCVATFRLLGNDLGRAEELRLLGHIALQQGDPAGAAAAYTEWLKLPHTMREIDLAFAIEGLALALARIFAGDRGHERLQLAVRLMGAAAAVRDRLHGPAARNWSVTMPSVSHAHYAEQLASARAVLGETAFEAAWTAGHRTPLDRLLAEADTR